MVEVPDAFVEQLRSFLSEVNLLEGLGICALGHSEAHSPAREDTWSRQLYGTLC